MKKLVFCVVIFLATTILIFPHFNLMKLQAKKEAFKKEIAKTKKRNAELVKRRDVLKKADYETVRKEAIELGHIKEGEKVIRFTP